MARRPDRQRRATEPRVARPLDFANIHVQHVVRATCGDETGLGVLEQLVIGPYEPSGLDGLLDGAQ